MKRTTFVTVSTLVLSLALLTSSAATASAGVSDSRTVSFIRFYDGDGIGVLASGGLEGLCTGDLGSPGQAHEVVTPVGIHTLHVRLEHEVAVYDLTAQGVDTMPELIDQACATVAGGGNVPEPLMTGTGVLTVSGRCVLQGPVCPAPGATIDERNGVVATVVDQDGLDHRVRARARITLDFTTLPPVEEVLDMNVVVTPAR